MPDFFFFPSRSMFLSDKLIRNVKNTLLDNKDPGTVYIWEQKKKVDSSSHLFINLTSAAISITIANLHFWVFCNLTADWSGKKMHLNELLEQLQGVQGKKMSEAESLVSRLLNSLRVVLNLTTQTRTDGLCRCPLMLCTTVNMPYKLQLT